MNVSVLWIKLMKNVMISEVKKNICPASSWFPVCMHDSSEMCQKSPQNKEKDVHIIHARTLRLCDSCSSAHFFSSVCIDIVYRVNFVLGLTSAFMTCCIHNNLATRERYLSWMKILFIFEDEWFMIFNSLSTKCESPREHHARLAYFESGQKSFMRLQSIQKQIAQCLTKPTNFCHIVSQRISTSYSSLWTLILSENRVIKCYKLVLNFSRKTMNVS
jgi:hypothetical protein